MNDEIILRSLNAASNIPFVDEDGVTGIEHRHARSDLVHRDPTSEATSVVLKQSTRNGQQSFTSFRSMVQSRIVQEGSVSALQKGVMLARKDSPQYRRVKQSSSSRRDKNETIEADLDEPTTLQRYENAVLKYQKPKTRPKRQASRDRKQYQQQQQQSSHGCSSSDESVARNKSKSISSIDTQSVNNILDEYEDLDYRRSSDLSDSGSVDVSNFEAVMMDQQKKQQQQQQEKSRVSASRMQSKRSPVRERSQPVLKVNQQTQVRQRSRERQKEPPKPIQPSPTEDNPSPRVSQSTQSTDTGRVRVPEVLLRKGEVQKRVDEWLSQTQSQNFPVSREKPLIRSNSSAEQKSQRRYRQDSRSRSIDEGRDKLNGTSSSYDDLSRADRKPDNRRLDKVAANPGRGTYKEYLALKSRGKQQDYGFSASTSVIGRSRDASPSTGSRIPQRGPLTSSFRSRRLETSNESNQADNCVADSAQHCQAAKNGRARTASDNRSTNLVKSRNESSGLSGTAATGAGSSSSSVIPCRRASFKRSQNHDQSGSTRPLVKEETGQRTRGGASTKGPSNLGDQGEPISPNKVGESRRSGLASDKATDAACKSTETSRSIDRSTPSGNRQETTEQTRQENAYGVVGARVRSLQGQQDCRVAKTRNPRGGTMLSDARKPPVLPRKDQDSKNSSIRSSFKPNSRVYATLQQLNEQNSAKSRCTVTHPADRSPGRSPYNSSNHVEKIYERSLQPQVIHANDLESILRPCLQVSAYGEPARSDRCSPPREAVTLQLQNDHGDDDEEEAEEEEEVYERVGELRYEHLETIVEDDRKSEVSVYPEIGLTHCLKIQQTLTNGRDRPNEPSRTFVTFHSPGSPRTNLQPRTANVHEEKREVDEPILILDDLEIPYDPGNAVDRGQSCHTRQNSDLSTATIPLDELESERQEAKFKVEDDCVRSTEIDSRTMNVGLRDNINEEKSDKTVGNDKSNSREIDVGRVSVVNEVLLKNLQFKQDLPKDPVERVGESLKIIEQRPIGFHNVLCDDYEHARGSRFKENKVYVTKEEMERQRLMDLLRKGDYESVRMVSDD